MLKFFNKFVTKAEEIISLFKRVVSLLIVLFLVCGYIFVEYFIINSIATISVVLATLCTFLLSCTIGCLVGYFLTKFGLIPYSKKTDDKAQQKIIQLECERNNIKRKLYDVEQKYLKYINELDTRVQEYRKYINELDTKVQVAENFYKQESTESILQIKKTTLSGFIIKKQSFSELIERDDFMHLLPNNFITKLSRDMRYNNLNMIYIRARKHTLAFGIDLNNLFYAVRENELIICGLEIKVAHNYEEENYTPSINECLAININEQNTNRTIVNDKNYNGFINKYKQIQDEVYKKEMIQRGECIGGQLTKSIQGAILAKYNNVAFVSTNEREEYPYLDWQSFTQLNYLPNIDMKHIMCDVKEGIERIRREDDQLYIN